MRRQRVTMLPGCLAALMLSAFFPVPFFFFQLMLTAVSRLRFPAEVGLLILIGIFLGSAVNIPVRRIVRVIGADLLHLNRMKEVATGLASMGGAGTFDGIVLSGMLAALLA